MAMYVPHYKRFKSNACPPEAYHETIKTAGSEILPWRLHSSEEAITLIETLAYSANTSPDFVFLALLAATATTMGQGASVKCLDYEEPVNIFIMCIGYPGSGKTQALKLAVETPINSILASWNRGVLLDDFTREGFRKLLQAKDGRVLIASDEIAGFFNTLDNGSGTDRYLLCRLFNCSSWTKTTGKGFYCTDCSPCVLFVHAHTQYNASAKLQHSIHIHRAGQQSASRGSGSHTLHNIWLHTTRPPFYKSTASSAYGR